jgi:uncharacterized YccA/Bax inhibitor family protein
VTDAPTPAPRGSEAGPENDPVLARRAQVARWCDLGKRTGYSLILGAMVVFVYGFVTDFGPAVRSTIVGCIAGSAVVLIPALIFGYGVKAAERDEAGEKFRY